MATQQRARTLLVCNALVPGSGLILQDRLAPGAGLGLIFAGVSNFTLAAFWLIPESVPSPLAEVGLGATVATWCVAQIATAQRLRSGGRKDSAVQRRGALRLVQDALAAGDADAAHAAIAPLAELADQDLLVAVRLAQVLTAKRDAAGAAGAWERVRRLDRHHIYRAQRIEATQRLNELNEAPPVSTEAAPEALGFAPQRGR